MNTMNNLIPDTFAFGEQMKKMADMQAKAFEPMRLFGGLAVETMDHVVRKHYAVMGDMVEYTLKQAHLPLSGENPADIVNAQVAETQAFGELIGTRANEYAEIANTFGTRAKAVVDDSTAMLKSA